MDQNEEAVRAFQKAIEFEPKDAAYYGSLAGSLRKLGRNAQAIEPLARARELMPADEHYGWACLEAIADNVEIALEHLAQALTQSPGLRNWAKRDPDLVGLHGHPRFEALVGNDAE